jgi:2,4-diaminopentanoate dehydrogenase
VDNYAAIAAGAGRIVNAIPAVVAAEPGLHTALDLPLITARGKSRPSSCNAS